MLIRLGTMMGGVGTPQETSVLADPYSLFDGDPPLTSFQGGDIICEYDGAVWGAQGLIQSGTVSKQIEVEAGVDIEINGVTFTGVARAVINIDNSEGAQAVNVVVNNVTVPESGLSTIIATSPGTVTLTVDQAVFDLPFTFRDYWKVEGDPTGVWEDGLGEPYWEA